MKPLLIFFSAFIMLQAYSQERLEYGDFVQLNNKIKWAVEYDGFFNLMPKTAKYSIKNAYLKALRDSGIDVYIENADRISVTKEKLNYNDFKSTKFDTVLNENLSNEAFPIMLGEDSIIQKRTDCICEDCARKEYYQIFKVKQILSYGEGEFSIKNILLTPLCIKTFLKKSTESPPATWNKLFNIAFTNGDNIISNEKDLIFIREEDYHYTFDEHEFIKSKNKLTTNFLSLTQLIYNDAKKGKLKLYDPEDGKMIPPSKIINWKTEKIKVPVFDSLGVINAYKVMQPERNLDSLKHFRIVQEFYFDKKNRVLISKIKSIDIQEPVFISVGLYLGNRNLFRFYPKNYQKK